jgi:DNA polymerase-3 subunit epsilon
MNSGTWVPPFIEAFTGISNAMLAAAPPARAVMREVLQFTRGCPLVAHNAAFDRSFWQAETEHAGAEADPAHDFACTLLLSRRLYPQAPNHQLGTLADFHHLPRSGRAHRALADAEVTAHLLLQLQQDVRTRYGAALGPVALAHRHLCELQRTPKAQLDRCFLSPAPRQKARPRRGQPA